jgi:hypothetical protein
LRPDQQTKSHHHHTLFFSRISIFVSSTAITMPSPSELAPLIRRGLISPPRRPRKPTPEIPPNSLLRPWLAVTSPASPEPERPHVGELITLRALVIRSIFFGLPNGLTMAFALVAALSALGDAKVVIIGALAQDFVGLLALGLGAYFAAGLERQHW